MSEIFIISTTGNSGGGGSGGPVVGNGNANYGRDTVMIPETKGEDGPMQISVTRPAQDQTQFQTSHEYMEQVPKGCCSSAKECMSYEFSKERLMKGLRARLPFIDWVRKYDLKENIVGDVVSGITIGIMQIPLGMSYAMLAGVPAVNGLYVSFFGVLLYSILGTSRHISQGTFAVISLMFAKTVIALGRPEDGGSSTTAAPTTVSPLTFDTTLSFDTTATTDWGSTTVDYFTSTASTTPPGDTLKYTRTEVAAAIALLVGIFQVVFGFLRIGNLNIYLSDILISGFTTGCGVLVFTSQVDALLGIKLPQFDAPFEIVKKYIYIFSHWEQTNLPTIIISIISIVILAIFAELINPWVLKRIPVPIPIELIAVVIGTSVSAYCDLPHNYGVKIVGNVPKGMPLPFLPPIGPLFKDIVGDCFSVAIISFVVSYAVARMFSKRYNYDLNANQEFIAYGASNVFCSFFSGFPMCVAMSRTMVQVEIGVKTQFAGLVSSIIVLIVLLAIAPLFKYLPNCVLASIIVVAIRRIFLQVRDCRRAWGISKLEALTWIITFLVVSLITIGIGFLAGVLFAIISVVLTSQAPRTCLLGLVPDTGLYKDIKTYSKAQEEPEMKIYQFSAPLIFANSKTFRKQLYSLTGIYARAVYKKIQKLEKKEEKALKKANSRKQSKEVANSLSKSVEPLNITSNGDLNHHHHEKHHHIRKNGVAGMGGETNPAFEHDGMDNMHNNNYQISSSITAIAVSSSDSDDVSDSNSIAVNSSVQQLKASLGIHHIILDFSCISFVDSSGVSTILQVIDEYKRLNIVVLVACCSDPVLEMLSLSNFSASAPKDVLYPTVVDAVNVAKYQHALETTKNKAKTR